MEALFFILFEVPITSDYLLTTNPSKQLPQNDSSAYRDV